MVFQIAMQIISYKLKKRELFSGGNRVVKYIFKRLIYLVFVFVIISVVLFFVYKAVPGDPAAVMLEGSRLTMEPEQYDQQYKQLREKLGLDDPLPVQFAIWFGNVIQGDLGYSTQYRMDVKDVITQPLLNTIKLNIPAVFLVMIITIPLGIATAVKKNTLFDSTVQVTSIIGYSMPTFIVALVCIFIFAIKIPLFPISGVNSPGFEGEGMARALDTLYHMALPLIVIILGSIGGVTRYVRAAMIEALHCDYIRTARAKGLSEKVVIFSHAFRNALIPVVTILTGWVISVFAGSIVLESIFLWNGIGKMLIDGLVQRDFSIVLAMQLFYVVLSLLGNLIMDIGYAFVDPRVKLGG